jgi:hypothetical protein
MKDVAKTLTLSSLRGECCRRPGRLSPKGGKIKVLNKNI